MPAKSVLVAGPDQLTRRLSERAGLTQDPQSQRDQYPRQVNPVGIRRAVDARERRETYKRNFTLGSRERSVALMSILRYGQALLNAR
jgi:hypothetical protein